MLSKLNSHVCFEILVQQCYDLWLARQKIDDFEICEFDEDLSSLTFTENGKLDVLFLVHFVYEQKL